MNKHPLIGKVLHWDSPDGEYFTLSRFTADLGNGFMLAERTDPRTGESLNVEHVILLAQLVERDIADIYDNWQAHEQATTCPHEKKSVVKLVPRPNGKDAD
jgi:hypothetical protein